MNKVMIAAALFSAALVTGINNYRSFERTPAADEPFELSLSTLSVDALSKLPNIEAAYLRATFNEDNVVEFFNQAPFQIVKGQKKALNAKLEIDPSWIKSDNLEFKLELVNQKAGDHVVLRCAQISKSLSEYNRSYQCTIPGEKNATLTYRLARKGDPVGDTSVARL